MVFYKICVYFCVMGCRDRMVVVSYSSLYRLNKGHQHYQFYLTILFWTKFSFTSYKTITHLKLYLLPRVISLLTHFVFFCSLLRTRKLTHFLPQKVSKHYTFYADFVYCQVTVFFCQIQKGPTNLLYLFKGNFFW